MRACGKSIVLIAGDTKVHACVKVFVPLKGVFAVKVLVALMTNHGAHTKVHFLAVGLEAGFLHSKIAAPAQSKSR